MSKVCRQLGRIWRSTKSSTTAAQPSTAIDRPSRSSSSSDRLVKEPNVDALAATFKKKSVSSSFRNRYHLYLYVIDRLHRHKRFSAIEDIIETHKSYKEIVHEGYAVRLIRLYGSAGMFQHAHKLFDELPQLKCQRTISSLNALMGAALHSKEFERVRELFEEYPLKLGLVADAVSYNIEIKALVELGSVDDAVSMVDEMVSKGLEPCLITFNSLIDGTYRKKGFEEGEKVWSFMSEKMKDLVPDIKNYNSKLNGMANEGMVTEAVDLFGELKIRGLKPNTFTYNHLIKLFCDKGDLEEAKKWYKKLVATDGLLPNWVTFETLVPVLCDNGDTDLAFELSKNMLGRHFIVDESLLQMVVNKLVEDSKASSAKKLVELGGMNFYYQYKLVMPSVE